VVRKFAEDDYAKLERLLDLREGYEARVQAQDEKIARENEEQELDEDEIKEEEPLRALERLEAGLYCMQLIDLILAHLCAENLDLELEEENKASGASSSSAEEPESEIKLRAKTLLNRRGQSLDDIKDNVKGE
jgi:beta-catenin-like protein 1